MQQNCQLCRVNFAKLPTRTKNGNYVTQLQQIIASCKKYLSKDIFQGIIWNVHPDADLFCEECSENTQQLLQLDLKLEQLNNEIKHIVNKISEKVSNEHTKYYPENYSDIKYAELGDYANQTNSEMGIPGTVPISLQLDISNEPFGVCDVTISQDLFDDIFPEDHVTSDEEYTPKTATRKIPSVEKMVTRRSKRIKIKKEKQKNSEGPKNTSSNSEIQYETVEDGFVCKNCNKKFTKINILNRHKCDSQTCECKVCGKSFSSHGSLQLHLLIHSGEKSHECHICGKSFLLPHQLRLHIKTHSAEKPFQCNICQKDFKHERYLLMHKVQHSSDEKERRPFSCTVCSKSFTLKSSLRLHSFLHNKNSKKYQCKTCGKCYTQAKLLRKHEQSHTTEKPFKCPHCYKTYRSKDGMKTHAESHKGEKSFQCDQCSMSYYSKPSLQVHVAAKHNLVQGNFICETCGKHCKSKIQLRHHLKNHEYRSSKEPGVQPYKCVVCERSYSDQRGLIDHQQLVHIVATTTKFPCEKCRVEFLDYVEYRNHLKVRGKSDKSIFQFKCQVCVSRPKIFSTRCDMNEHYNEKHTEAQYPYKCAICIKGFLGRNAYRKHYRECTVIPTEQEREIMKRVSTNKKEKPGKSNSNKDHTTSNLDEEFLTQNLEQLFPDITVRRSNRTNHESAYAEKPEGFPGENDNGYSFAGDDEPENIEIKVEPCWIKEEIEDYSD